MKLALGGLHKVIRVRVGKENIHVKLKASIWDAGLQGGRVR